VIGNGHGCPDGEIQIGPRWESQQSPAAPAGVQDIDPDCISICLIGNLDRAGPTAMQLQTLAQLVAALQTQWQIGSDKIILLDQPNSPPAPAGNSPSAISARRFCRESLNSRPVIRISAAAEEVYQWNCFSDLALSRFKDRVLGSTEMPSPSKASTPRIGSDPSGPKMMGVTVPPHQRYSRESVFKFHRTAIGEFVDILPSGLMPALRRALAGARQSTAPVSTRNSAANPLPPPASLRTVVVTCVKPIGTSYGRKMGRTSAGDRTRHAKGLQFDRICRVFITGVLTRSAGAISARPAGLAAAGGAALTTGLSFALHWICGLAAQSPGPRPGCEVR